jgi:hypothetical protein
MSIERYRRGKLANRPHQRLGAVSILATATGAIAFGAAAIGAIAIGRMLIGEIVAKKTRFRSIEVDELTVKRLRVLDGGREDDPKSN